MKPNHTSILYSVSKRLRNMLRVRIEAAGKEQR